MIDFALAGKTAIVTGGTAGIGRAVATQFVKAGARVGVVGRREAGTAIAIEIGGTFFNADVTDQSQVAALFAVAATEFGPLDVIVLNAGIDPGQATIADTEPEDLERNLDVNFRHVFWGLKHGPVRMRDGGSIRNRNRRPRQDGFIFGSVNVADIHCRRCNVVNSTRPKRRRCPPRAAILRSIFRSSFAAS